MYGPWFPSSWVPNFKINCCHCPRSRSQNSSPGGQNVPIPHKIYLHAIIFQRSQFTKKQQCGSESFHEHSAEQSPEVPYLQSCDFGSEHGWHLGCCDTSAGNKHSYLTEHDESHAAFPRQEGLGVAHSSHCPDLGLHE